MPTLLVMLLAFKPINFIGKQTQKKPTGKKKKKKKKPQITTIESKNIKIKPKQKNRNPATSKAPPLNQIIHYHINENTPKPNHPKKAKLVSSGHGASVNRERDFLRNQTQIFPP